MAQSVARITKLCLKIFEATHIDLIRDCALLADLAFQSHQNASISQPI
jgi:hypothetical protein